MQHKGIEIWSRPITPIYQTYYSYAIAFVNRRTDGTPSDVAVTLRELGLISPTGYRVEVRDKSPIAPIQITHDANKCFVPPVL